MPESLFLLALASGKVVATAKETRNVFNVSALPRASLLNLLRNRSELYARHEK